VRKTGFVRFQGLSSGKPGGASGHRGRTGWRPGPVNLVEGVRETAPGVDGRTPTPYRARPSDLVGSQGTVWVRDDDGAEGDPVQISDRGGAGGANSQPFTVAKLRALRFHPDLSQNPFSRDFLFSVS
jgi:hypothetical protein